MNRAEKRRHQKMAKQAAKKRPPPPLMQDKTLSIQQALELAVQHHNAGELQKAENIYQQILQTDPNQHVALHFLGLIAHQVGENDVAVELIQKAIIRNPNYAEAHNNLGNVLKKQGRLDDAVTRFLKALSIKPDYANAYNNLGNVLKEQGRLDDAVANYDKALTINPDYAEAHNNLGIALQEQGRLDAAVASYHKALTVKPDYAEAHNNLGIALQKQGSVDDAVVSYRRALTINPDYAAAHSNLGNALQEQGLSEEAMKCFRKAISHDPQNDGFWANFGQSVKGVIFTSADDDLYRDLLHFLKRPAAGRPSNFVKPIVSALFQNAEFSKLFDQTVSGNLDKATSFEDVAIQLSKFPLFLEILKLAPISDLEIEKMLRLLRQGMQKDALKGNINVATLPFSTALALQCFINEYVYLVSEEEINGLNTLEQQVIDLLNNGQNIPPFILVTLGAYKPLHEYSWAESIQDCEWGDDSIEVVERQISEPKEEQSLRSKIPCLTPIKDAVSHSVREQYEKNPYPRWVKTSLETKAKSIKDTLQEFPFHFDLEESEFPKSPQVLIAGCGTGQHSIQTASRFSNTIVLAVDLSLSSLSHSLRKTNELKISNIEYSQADIMELGSIGQKFDLIESIGVLHHLGDPMAGWQVLTKLLQSGGIMRIGLYSETARQSVIEGRSIIADKEYGRSPEDIRRCRQDIITMAECGNEEIAKLLDFADFYSMSECRDLLFHVQEHRFTLPQIEDALNSLNLKFLGFEFADQSTMKKFEKSNPNKSSQSSFSLWKEFEQRNPDTFIGMYQFWCQKR